MSFDLCGITEIEPNCLSQYIDIIGCSKENPNMVVIGGMHTPIISLKKAAQASSTSGMLFLAQIKALTIEEISRDIVLLMQGNGFSLNGSGVLQSSMRQQIQDVANCPPPTNNYMTYNGVSVNIKNSAQSPATTLSIDGLFLYSKQAYANFEFYVRLVPKTATSSTIIPVTVSILEGKNDLIALAGAQLTNPIVSSNVARVDVFYKTADYPNVCSVPLYTRLTTGSGCSSCSTYSYSCVETSCANIYPISGNETHTTINLSTPSERSNAYGLEVQFRCICDFGSVICGLFTKQPLLLKSLVATKAQQLFAKMVGDSDRANCFTLLKGKSYSDSALELEDEYIKSFNNMIKVFESTLRSFDKNCIACKENIKISSNV